MALNWQHIKGANGDTPVYTYLEFGTEVDSQPELFTLTVNQAEKPSTGGLGYVVTTSGSKPFTKDVQLNKGIKLILDYSDTPSNYLYYDETNKQLCFYGQQIAASGNLSVTEKLTTKNLEVSGTSNFKDTVTIDNGKTLKVGTTEVGAEKIDAPYFNALSDSRAKENIQPFSQSALDIINHLQTYTYTYKDSHLSSYGIMAQDLVNYTINDFSFVENTAASGQDGDYMSIHETKLVYLLIEGMKEQQKQIENLKRQLELLSK